jgi:hypothetical protein
MFLCEIHRTAAAQRRGEMVTEGMTTIWDIVHPVLHSRTNTMLQSLRRADLAAHSSLTCWSPAGEAAAAAATGPDGLTRAFFVRLQALCFAKESFLDEVSSLLSRLSNQARYRFETLLILDMCSMNRSFATSELFLRQQETHTPPTQIIQATLHPIASFKDSMRASYCCCCRCRCSTSCRSYHRHCSCCRSCHYRSCCCNCDCRSCNDDVFAPIFYAKGGAKEKCLVCQSGPGCQHSAQKRCQTLKAHVWYIL